MIRLVFGTSLIIAVFVCCIGQDDEAKRNNDRVLYIEKSPDNPLFKSDSGFERVLEPGGVDRLHEYVKIDMPIDDVIENFGSPSWHGDAPYVVYREESGVYLEIFLRSNADCGCYVVSSKKRIKPDQ